MRIFRLICFTYLWLPIASLQAEDLNALLAKGDALYGQSQDQKALDVYLVADKDFPGNAEVLRRLARSYAEKMTGTDSPAEKRQLGLQALDYARRAVACDSNNAMAHLAAAVCYGRLAPLMDNKTKISYSRLVKEQAEQALALDPSCDLTYHVLGAWNYELASLSPFLRGLASMIYGQLPSASYGEAVKDFKKALALNPNRLGTHVELGRTYLALGDIANGRAEIKRALAMPEREKDDSFEKARGREALGKL